MRRIPFSKDEDRTDTVYKLNGLLMFGFPCFIANKVLCRLVFHQCKVHNGKLSRNHSVEELFQCDLYYFFMISGDLVG